MAITTAEGICAVLLDTFRNHLVCFVPLVADRLETSWQLLALGERLVKVEVADFQPETGDVILWGTAIRGTKTYKAVLYLCSLGYGPQATMLNRTLIEDALTARWTELNRDEAQELIERHEQHNLHLANEMLAKRKLDLGSLADLEPLTNEERTALSDDFGKFGEKPWTGHRMWKLLDVFAEDWGDEFQQKLFDHMRIHVRHANQTVHNTAISIVKPTFPERRPLYDTAESEDDVKVALLAGFWAYGNLFRVVLQGDQRAEFEAFYAENMATLFRP